MSLLLSFGLVLNLQFSFDLLLARAISDPNPGDGEPGLVGEPNTGSPYSSDSGSSNEPGGDPDGGSTSDSAPPSSYTVCLDCSNGGGIPIPLPVIGWAAGSEPVIVTSELSDGGVYVWSGSGDKGRGVKVWNTEDDPMRTYCVPADPVCAYFMRLSRQETDKVAKLLLYEEKYIQVLFNQFSNTCPTFAKMAGIALISDPEKTDQPPIVKVAENIVESSCKNLIDNWETALIDKTKAVTMALSEYFENLDFPFLDAIGKKSLIQQLNNEGAYEELPESLRLQGFLVDSIGGSYVEANTSLLAFVRRLTRPMSKANLALMVNSYVQGEQKKAGDALLEDARLGGGLLSKYEVTSEVVDTKSGKKYPGKIIVNYPASIQFDDLSKVRTGVLDSLANTIDFNKEVSPQLFPELNSGDGLWYGGTSQLRDLLNTTMEGGPGIFRVGNPAPALPPEAQTPSSCSIAFSDASLTMGLNEQRKYSFSVNVRLGVNLPGSVSDIENIKISFQDPSFAQAAPALLGPQNATQTNVFIITINSKKAGGTDMDINATLKSSAGGADCGASIGLEILPYERYACSSQKCKSPTINPDPDNTLYTCVGTPDDGLNNDCTSLGSNCKQEWCTDIGDKDKDGFNALCYDSCGVDYQSSCQRAGYICNATSTSGLPPSNKVGAFSAIKQLSVLIKNSLKF